jgi:hypothetical protein
MDSPQENLQDNEATQLHDSMVTVRLSEPPSLHLNTTISATLSAAQRRDLVRDKNGQDTPDILLEEAEEDVEEESPRITMMDPNGNEVLSPTGSESAGSRDGESRRGSDSSDASVEGGDVNWEELERTEEKEPRDESSDDVSGYTISSYDLGFC